MTITKNINGSLTLSIMVNNYRESMTYCSYTTKEAKQAFREHLKTVKGGK